MKPNLLSVLGVLVLSSLFGCASLPVAGPTPQKYLAVYYEAGATDTGVTHAVETWNTPEPFRLRTGLNYIPVPIEAKDEMLTDFSADRSSQGRTYRLMTKSIYQLVALPDGASIVLVPLVLSSRISSGTGGNEWQAVVTPMTAAKVQSILEAWKKDKNAAGWSQLLVAELLSK